MRGLHSCRLFAMAVVVLAIANSTVAPAQTFSVLYNFGSKSGDPHQPSYAGIVAQGRDGNLYSTTPIGGVYGKGAAFQITQAGKLTVLHSFDGMHDGANPYSGLTLGSDGNFYGASNVEGTNRFGTVFKLTPSGSLTVLHNFTGGRDGANPYAPPIQGRDGSFYGTTMLGGFGFGTIYKVTSSGNFTPLYRFDIIHGCAPAAPLVQGTDGNFYGTTTAGGPSEQGSVFKITPGGKLTVLYNFDITHGQNPFGPVVQGSDGNFYGTTAFGGANGRGTVFKITPAGKLAVLHNMNRTIDGVYPYAGLAQATDGNFYGANGDGGKASSRCSTGCGTMFKITPKGALAVVHNFDYTTGNFPVVTPFQHTNGIVYGDTLLGGVSPCGFCGVFYSWNANLPSSVSLLPYSGKVGKTIEFLGQGFKGTDAVFFNGTASSFKVVSDTYLTAVVPKGATTGFVIVSTSEVKLKSNKKFQVLP